MRRVASSDKDIEAINRPQYVNFDEKEDSTKIRSIICLETSYVKRILVVPFLTIITAGFLLLFMHWYKGLRKVFLYSECSLYRATRLYIVGISGNINIVELERSTQIKDEGSENTLLTFDYRFIRYKFDYNALKFVPIKFESELPYS